MRYLYFKNESNKNLFYAQVFGPKFKNITNISNIPYVTCRNFLIFHYEENRGGESVKNMQHCTRNELFY